MSYQSGTVYATFDATRDRQVLESGLIDRWERCCVIVRSPIDVHVQRMSVAIERTTIRSNIQTNGVGNAEVGIHNGIHFRFTPGISH